MLSIRVLLAALLFGLSVTATAETPEAVVAAFYDRFIHHSPKYRGRPYYERVADLTTSQLLASLKAQYKYERFCAKIAPPDIKPHMIDQNPFFLAPDGVAQYFGAKTTLVERSARVVAHLSDGYIKWHDTVVLVQEKGRWRISNIEWEGDGTLAQRLSSFMSYRCET
ncbi:DUF3828 domain-containing protein [Undibacterium sp. Ji22W]|uniref:DUF3828 domain-containing protein n=1 Tax=Undibacterium sp. Ji22W TaxID=3413038 RepID=UPI003BF406F0